MASPVGAFIASAVALILGVTTPVALMATAVNFAAVYLALAAFPVYAFLW
jgi:hypothetical protein